MGLLKDKPIRLEAEFLGLLAKLLGRAAEPLVRTANRLAGND